jgi:hypothetical protein
MSKEGNMRCANPNCLEGGKRFGCIVPKGWKHTAFPQLCPYCYTRLMQEQGEEGEEGEEDTEEKEE